MKSWTLILCEGAHDQKFIAALLKMCAGWHSADGVPDSLPEPIAATYPKPKPTKSGGFRIDNLPDFLCKDDRYVTVRNLGGVERVLGQIAIDFLETANPNGVGVFVDANDAGINRRVLSFRNRYRPLYAHAAETSAGRVSPGQPRIGLWVAPDNVNNGHLDELVLTAARRSKRKRVERGERFITSIERAEPGQLTKHRTKAILGAIAQVEVPGGSLAVAIERAGGWLDPNMGRRAPFKSIVQFLEDLTSAAMGSSDQREGDRG